MVKVNDEHILNKIDYNSYQERVNQINKMIDEKTGPGSDFLGWLNYPDK